MAAALYGKAEYPPIGLEVDIVFSQLRYVTEQMPYGANRVLFDRRGRLGLALVELARPRPQGDVVADLRFLSQADLLNVDPQRLEPRPGRPTRVQGCGRWGSTCV